MSVGGVVVMNLDDAIAEVARARRRLTDDQGRLARKNARAALKNAIGTALRAMDREYPLIRKERVVKVSMSPLAKKRRARAKRVALLMVTNAEALTLATMGIKVVATEKESLTLKAPNGTTSVATPIQNHFAPSWIVRALRTGIAAVEIKRAVRSRPVRERIEAFLRLRSGASKVT